MCGGRRQSGATRTLLAALLVWAAGCGPQGRDTVTLRFWNGFTGPDGRTMLRLVQQFNAANPDVHVLMQRMDWGTYYNKLFVAGLGGRAPAVFVVHAGHIERFVRAGFLGPVDDLVAGTPGLAPDLDGNVWSAVGRDGVHYGLPLDVHILGLYYNKRMFREAGLVDASGCPTPPATRDAFLRAAQALTRDHDGDGTPDQWGFVFTWFRTNAYAVMCQWGGQFFTEAPARCGMANPENAAALAFCADLIRRYHVAPPPENFDAWIGFRQGKVGMVFEGVYMLADLEKQADLEFAGAPLPQLGPHPATWADSHVLCLRSDLPGREREAAWRFCRFLSDHSLDWAEGGQVPVRRSLRASERFSRMPVQAAFARQLDHIHYVPPVPFIFEFFTEYDAAVERALRGSATPEAALEAAAANVNRAIGRSDARRAGP